MRAVRNLVCLLGGVIGLLLCTVGYTSALTWQVVDVDTSEGILPNDLRFDAGGAVHILYQTDAQLKYATCPGQCANPSRWNRVVLWEGAVASASLAVSPSGSVHVLFSLPEVETGGYYVSCAGTCGQAANWSLPIFITDPSYPVLGIRGNSSLVLDEYGNPRGIMWGYDQVEYQVFVSFLWCDGECLDPGNWHLAKIVVGDPMWGLGDHSIDKNGAAYVMTYYRTVYKNSWLESKFCLSNCQDPSNWADGPRVPGSSFPSPLIWWSPVRIRTDGSASFAGTIMYDPETMRLLYRSYLNPQGSQYYEVVIAQDMGTLSLALTTPIGVGDPPKPRLAALSQAGLHYVSCDSGCEEAYNWAMEVVDPLALLIFSGRAAPKIALNASNVPGILYLGIGPINEDILRFAFGSVQAPPWSLATEATASTYGLRAASEGAKINYMLVMIIPGILGLLISIAWMRRR